MPRRHQADLFDGAPSVPTARDLQITARGRAPLGKEQQTFNRLLAQVQKLRDKLRKWTEFDFRHQQRIARELMPLVGELTQARRDLIQLCADVLAGHRGGGVGNKTERRQLTAFLLEVCEAHLADAGGDDEEDVVAVYDRYAPRSFAELQDEERRKSRAAIQEMFGIDIGDAPDVDPMEAVMVAARREAEAAERAREQRTESRRARQSARAREREAERAAAKEQAAREISQSMRDVYRKLASALHPDRGGDDAERQRRHQLMQRVNQAYEGRDLLDLLTLQLEIEQIDEDHLATVSASRLRHYNQVLRDQVTQLKSEIEEITERFEMAMQTRPRSLTPEAVARDLTRGLAEAAADLTEMREHTESLLDARFRRRWLREYTRESREARRMQEIEDLVMFGIGLDLADDTFRPGGSTRPNTGRNKKRQRKRR